MSDQIKFTKICDSIWGTSDILETDHELIEFNLNFPTEEDTKVSMIDFDSEIYPSKMNFPKSEVFNNRNENDPYDSDDGDEHLDEHDFDREANNDGMFYLI